MHLFDIDWLGNLGIKNGTWEKKKRTLHPHSCVRMLSHDALPFCSRKMHLRKLPKETIA